MIIFIDLSFNILIDWDWDFGDGGSSSIFNLMYIFNVLGIYIICFISSNICGSNQFCQQIVVSCVVLDFVFINIVEELLVNFQDNIENVFISWLWIFGDGNGFVQ